ncbi:MAG: FAD binding domain-containing protein [Acidobacteriia bacterium]|nr:FAD binding domain-containing protein [Terriglobia bacterium]
MNTQNKVHIQLTVNGKPESLQVDPSLRLLDVLRERLRLTGTKEGCGKGECGACTVIMDGRTVDSCLVMAYQTHGSEIWTIEGLPRMWQAQCGADPSQALDSRKERPHDLHPLQQAFVECGSAQCGICIPGMVMSAADLLSRCPDPTEEQIRYGLAGNLCRCTGYVKIFDAVRKAASVMKEMSGRSKNMGFRARRASLSLPLLNHPSGSDGRPHLTTSLKDALKILAKKKSYPFRQLAGGTDALVRAKDGIGSPTEMFDIFRIRELHGIRELKSRTRAGTGYGDAVVGEIWIGSATTFTEAMESPLLQKYAPALIQACAVIGGPQIRNRGTLGGNFANASPAADSVPALMSLGAVLEIASLGKKREVPADEFFLGPGKTVLKNGELIVGFRFPQFKNVVGCYLRLGQRQAQAISKVDIAVTAAPGIQSGQSRVGLRQPTWFLRICYGSVAPTVFRAVQTELILGRRPLTEEALQRAKQAIKREVKPIDDIRSSAEYRREMSAVLLERALEKIGWIPG